MEGLKLEAEESRARHQATVLYLVGALESFGRQGRAQCWVLGHWIELVWPGSVNMP